MKYLKPILKIYIILFCVILTIFIVTRGFHKENILVSILFLPTLLFFIFEFIEKKVAKISTVNIVLLLYNTLFFTVVIFSNLSQAAHPKDMLFALIFIPIELDFIYKLLPALNRVQNHFKTFKKEKTESLAAPSPVPTNVQEVRRRQFLKIIGGTSIGMLALYLLNPKNAGAAFFGSIPGPGTINIKDSTGTKIDPAIKSPLDGYGITNIDDASFPHYYGFIDKDGNWYILKEASDNTYRYSKGASSFSTNWTGRSGLTYDYFNVIF